MMFLIFFTQNIDCMYTLEPSQGDEVYSCIPQFYFITEGFKGVNISRSPTCVPDDNIHVIYVYNNDAFRLFCSYMYIQLS